jgi:RNA polymerase sigma-70 factor, ECF subfamily
MPHETPDVPSDEVLACRARGGCVASFEQLLRRYQTPVLHYLQHRGAGADAEDLLQETFLRAHRNLDRYREQWRFAAWIFTIARRVSINHHRRGHPHRSDRQPPAIERFEPDPAQRAAEDDDRRSLWGTAARVLSEEELTAIWLFYVEEMPAREIASVLGRSRTAVKTMLFRARKRLLPCLQGSDSSGQAGCQPVRDDRSQVFPLPRIEVRHV